MSIQSCQDNALIIVAETVSARRLINNGSTRWRNARYSVWNCLTTQQWLSGWKVKLASKKSVREYARYYISTVFMRLDAAV